MNQFRAAHYYPPLSVLMVVGPVPFFVQISWDFSNFTNMSILFPSTNPFDPPNLPFIRRCCTARAKTSQTGVCGSKTRAALSLFSRSLPMLYLVHVCYKCWLITIGWWTQLFLHIQRDICTYHTIRHCIYIIIIQQPEDHFLNVVKWSSTCTTPAFVITKCVLKQQSREYMTHGLAMSRMGSGDGPSRTSTTQGRSAQCSDGKSWQIITFLQMYERVHEEPWNHRIICDFLELKHLLEIGSYLTLDTQDHPRNRLRQS